MIMNRNGEETFPLALCKWESVEQSGWNGEFGRPGEDAQHTVIDHEHRFNATLKMEIFYFKIKK